jgi:hypothetical protein
MRWSIPPRPIRLHINVPNWGQEQLYISFRQLTPLLISESKKNIQGYNLFGVRQSQQYFSNVFLLLLHTHYMFRPLQAIFRRNIYWLTPKELFFLQWIRCFCFGYTLYVLMLCCHLRLGLYSGLFPWSFLAEILYVFLCVLIRATCSARLVFLICSF